MATNMTDAGTEKVFSRVSPELRAEIDQRAANQRQKPGEWIRETLAKAIEADDAEANKTNESIDHLARLIEARIDRLERRILDENSVMLRLGFEILFDLARVRALSMSASLALNNSTPEEEQGLLDHLEQEGVAYFLSRKNALFAELNEMRKEAKAKAEASANRLVTAAS